MANAFVPFGPDHLAAIALSLLAPFALVVFVRHGEREARTRIVRFILAALLMLGWIAWYAVLAERGWMGWGNVLPMHLCDWANIAILITLLKPNQKSYELAYFWTFGGTLQAMATPALEFGFPDVRFLIFFGFHCTIVISLLFLTFGTALRPRPGSIPRALAWSLVYVAAAMSVNWALGTNYGFLAAKPVQATLFDLLSPWPWYIPEAMAIGIAIVFLLYAPWFLWDRIRRNAVQPSVGTSER